MVAWIPPSSSSATALATDSPCSAIESEREAPPPFVTEFDNDEPSPVVDAMEWEAPPSLAWFLITMEYN